MKSFSNTEVVRVGCVDIDNFLIEENGSVRGYVADCLYEISKYTDWKYEYVHGTWNECMQLLQEGKIDLLFPAEYSEERNEKYLFSDIECCVDYVALIASADNDKLFYEDFENYNGMKIGMIKGNLLNSYFEKFADEKNISFYPFYYNNRTELISALKKDEVEAIVTGNLDQNTFGKLLAKFKFIPAYIISNKNNQKLMDELNYALYKMTLENPYFVAELINKYYGSISDLSKSFSRQEKEYIDTKPALDVVCDSSNFPFEWFDKEEGVYKGIDIDILSEIQEKSGIKFNYVKTKSLFDSWSLMSNNKADAIVGVYVDSSLSEKYHIKSSAVYTKEKYSIVASSSYSYKNGNNINVAINKSLVGLIQYVKTYYPNWNIVEYDSTQKCFDAINCKDVDVAVISTMGLQTDYLIKDNLRVITLSGIDLSLPISIGISNRLPDVLVSIINKSIHSISNVNIDQIVLRNTLMTENSFSIKNFIRLKPFLFVVIVFLFFIFITFSIIYIYNYVNKSRQYEILSKKNEELRKANAAKTEFFSRMSHDMRTPMNGIIGVAELSNDMEMSDEVHNMMSEIYDSGKYLLSLINDTLDMYKIENNKIEICKELYDGKKVFLDTIKIAKVYSHKKNITCNLKLDNFSFDYPILMDKLKVQQILLNIISNAVKFSPENGYIDILLKIIEQKESVIKVMCKVTDYGIGMSEEFIPKLFIPFEQENNGFSTQNNGSGLGMSIVKNFVDILGGKIIVESKKNIGTSITVFLDFEQVKDFKTENFENECNETYLLNSHILVCEDNQLNMSIAKKLLEKKGCIIECAYNGKVGIEKFIKSEVGYFDLILMDIRMPVVDGIQATIEIRKANREDAKNIPIIAMTANTFDIDVKKYLNAGLNAHLGKPIEPSELYKIISDYIKKYREKK